MAAKAFRRILVVKNSRVFCDKLDFYLTEFFLRISLFLIYLIKPISKKNYKLIFNIKNKDEKK